jgi:hypothetical protein
MLRHFVWFTALVTVFGTSRPSQLYADIKNWQTGETIPGTEEITPGPGVKCIE